VSRGWRIVVDEVDEVDEVDAVVIESLTQTALREGRVVTVGEPG
jgi:hypothetical protein